jgi:hypothetical protein
MEWQTPEVATPAVESLSAPASFDTTFDHDVGLTEARELISRHKRANPGSRSASMFTRVPLDAILAQQGCVGMRMYYGLNPDGERCLVLVGVDEFGNDMDEGVIADRSFGCPPICAMDSALDS